MVTVWSRLIPIGASSVGASFFIVVGTTKGLVLIGPKTTSVLRWNECFKVEGGGTLLPP